ncbi:hypothetical protein KP509_31G067500 [Ceratopteris richardii]|uniref:peptidyl-tRNA hydrolase n=1 Tax=Ceratopteris richardii TaxID=49495 RepID=A0A8T2R136_CERRI|nr:hypothetical protein KP509_31G067500 [Ceratopteris richardii]
MVHIGRSAASNTKDKKPECSWLASSLRPENFIPGLIIGFLLGLFMEIPKRVGARSSPPSQTKKRGTSKNVSASTSEELKMVFVVRQDLKMGSGKIASQCAHAAVGIYEELMQSQRQLLYSWEQCGQPKIVVTCKNQQEMNDLRAKAKKAGLPTFTVADAGRTQVAAGSKTVLVVGPGPKSSVDAITRHLRLL